MVDFLGGDPSELIFDLNSEFAGETMTDVMHLLIVTSFFAGCLALHNACSRYLLAMGRARILPVVLAKVSPTTGTPSVAGIVQGVLVFVAIAGFALTPGRSVHGGCSVDEYPHHHRRTCSADPDLDCRGPILLDGELGGEGLWQRLIAPSLAAVSLVVALGFLQVNMGTVTGLTTARNLLFVVPLVAAFAVGVVRSLWVRNHSIEVLSV